MIFINALYHDVILYIVSIAIVYLEKFSFMSIFPNYSFVFLKSFRGIFH